MNIQILSFLDTLIGKVCLFAAGMFSFAKRQLPEKFDHIVILKFLGFGSLILAAPALYAVKKRYPGAKIILYTTPGVQKHAGILHLFDEIIVLEPARPLYSIFTLFRLRCRFKGSKTLIFNLEFLSRISIFIAGFLRGSYTITLSEKSYRFPDRCIIPKKNGNMAMAAMYDSAAAVLGAVTDCNGYIGYLQKSFPAAAEKRLTIAPFCSNLSLRRLWDQKNWSDLISKMYAHHPEYSIAVIGAPEDRENARQIIKDSGVPEEAAHNFCGEVDFEEAAGIIRQSSCFCGIDSAPLHLARLFAVPAVSLWGATDPLVLTRNFDGYPEAVIFARQKCTPCVHTSKNCPLPSGCLNTIKTDTVFAAVEELLFQKINARKIVSPEQEKE